MNYYEAQLQKLGKTGNGFSTQIKLIGEKETNWLALNDESATAIVKMLTENFNIKSDKFGGNWCLADIISKASEMGYIIEEKEAQEIAAEIESNFDATIGVNWDIIEEAINEYLEN
jgi:hypothetical protein